MIDFVCNNDPFCISREYLAASEVSGMVRRLGADGQAVVASPEAVARLGVRIQWVANDVFSEIAPARLRQSCFDGVCVVFRVSCQDLTCSWQAAPIGADPSPFLSEVRLTATSAAALSAAKANVFVSVPGPNGPHLLPLSALGAGAEAPPRIYRGPMTADDQADQKARPRTRD